ncbi:hypothetical protein NG791_08505 [Laspinema sp. D1]|uniref:hypothetical protein n=1 Tax=Laspinema palackyanum TaxID=3231601 RepID=UPI00347C9716|nr:hypothetical protein [Laspinema sp. D2b]
MTEKLYLSERATTGRAKICAIKSGENSSVCLTTSLFHPQGGGQKADRGTIEGIAVLHVVHNNGEIDHYVENIDSFTLGQEVEIVVDEQWRLLNSKYHSAGHLIAALGEKLFPGIQAVAGHHWPGEARVEFTGDLPDTKQFQEAMIPALAEAIQADLPVRICGDPFKNRSISIGDFPAVPCGGTHPERLGVLEKVEISKIKIKQGKLRVSYSL